MIKSILEKLIGVCEDLIDRLEENERLLGGQRSPLWNKTKKEFEKLHPKICAVCRTDKKIHLHHEIPFHIRPDLENDFSNLIWLCKEHHFDRGHYRSWASYNSKIREDAKNWLERIRNRP